MAQKKPTSTGGRGAPQRAPKTSTGTKKDPRFGKPLGPVLEGLKRIRNPGGADSELFYLLGKDQDSNRVQSCRERHDVELLGRCHDQLAYFGVPRQWDAPTVDRHPVVTVDKTGIDPEVAAADLASFLSLIAYSPESWGNDPESWRQARADALENFPDEVRKLEKQLSALPGVSLPEEPWVLQEKLPTVPFGPAQGAPLTEEALREEASEIFKDHAERTRTKLLVDLSEVSFDPKARKGSFVVSLNCPEDFADEVSSHPVVKTPLKGFLAELREHHPGVELAIDLSFDPIDTGSGVEAALCFALEFAGAKDLIETLGLTG